MHGTYIKKKKKKKKEEKVSGIISNKGQPKSQY